MSKAVMLLALVIAAAIGAYGAWKLKPAPPLPAVVRDTVRVSVPQVIRERPTVETKFVNRIIYREVPPELIVVGEPDSTVRPEIPADPASTDTAATDTLPRLAVFAGRLTGNRLDLWIDRDDGSVLFQRHQARAPLEFLSDGRKVTVREQRALWRGLGKVPACLGAAGVGALGGLMAEGSVRAAVGGAVAGCGISIVF